MADKGFTISKELEEIGLPLNIPPFLGKRKQMGASDVKETQLIAHHRIHVERAIGKVTQLIYTNFHSHSSISFHMNFGSKSPNCF